MDALEAKEPNAGKAPSRKERGTGGGEQWKFALAVAVVSVCWSALRFEFARTFEPGDLGRVYDFTAALPFGKRVLPALVAHLWGWKLSLPQAFGIGETLSTAALVYGLAAVFRLFLDRKAARFLGMGVFAVLPFVFLAPCSHNYLFPWDTPAMAFTAWGSYFVLTEKRKSLVLLMVFASLNREQALLLPMLWVAATVDSRPFFRTMGTAVLLVAVYAACQEAVGTTLADNVPFYELRWGVSLKWGPNWRLTNNLYWLFKHPRHLAVWLGTLACLPVAFPWAVKSMPGYLRRFGLVAWAYGGLLTVVGNVYEARVYGEISILLYISVALALWECVHGTETFSRHRMGGKPNGLSKWMPVLETGCAAAVMAGLAVLAWLFAHAWKN